MERSLGRVAEASTSRNGCGRMADPHDAGTAYSQMYFDSGWPRSKLVIQTRAKVQRRTPLFERSSSGKQAHRRVTQSTSHTVKGGIRLTQPQQRVTGNEWQSGDGGAGQGA